MMNITTIQSNFFKIRSNKAFELFVVAVILFSALVIGAKTYDIPAHVLSIIVWLDRAITAFFSHLAYLKDFLDIEFKNAINSGDTVFR